VGRPSPAVQDYLKAIYHLGEDSEGGDALITTSQVAEALGVTPASASNMIRKLDGMGLAAQTKRQGVELTADGRQAALEVIRHHRLLETYLATRLGVPWDEVHREAEVLEHHLSEALEARIAEALGHPDRDPHGDPIPTVGGDVAAVPNDRLVDLADGAAATVSRVSDRDPALLRYLAELGLVPDARVEVLGRAPFGGPVAVRVGDGEVVDVPPDAARAVHVEAVTA
jgi:DtxR family transcriptional regulator, Mn-dependent transcriptional regulator